jgi:hypothetical protein
MFDKKVKFTEEIGNGNVPLDQTISAYRSVCQAIVASDEDARRAMFTIFSDAAFAYFYDHDTEWYSVSEVFAGLRGNFYDLATIEQLEIERTEYTWLRVKSSNPNIKDNHALLRCFLTRGRELQKQLPVDGYGAGVQLRNFLHRCTRHAFFSAYKHFWTRTSPTTSGNIYFTTYAFGSGDISRRRTDIHKTASQRLYSCSFTTPLDPH